MLLEIHFFIFMFFISPYCTCLYGLYVCQIELGSVFKVGDLSIEMI
jgi:hypothetical protein